MILIRNTATTLNLKLRGRLTNMKIVDLSVPLYDGLKTFPLHPRINVIDYVTHAFSQPRYLPPCKGFASKLVLISDHAGTHLDAPYHFVQEGKTIEQVDLEKTFGEAILIDVAARPLDQPVSAELLQQRLQETNTELREGDIVLLRTWPGEWNPADVEHATALDESGAKWLCEKKIKSFGIDLPSADTRDDKSCPAHMNLLGNGIGIMENIVNLDKLTKTRFFFMGVPLPIKGLTASPIRALAVEEW